MSEVLCKCGSKASYTQCKKAGKHYDDWFYGCPNFREPNFCGFFRWAEKQQQPLEIAIAEVTQAPAPRPAKRDREPSVSVREYEEFDVPRILRRLRAIRRTAQEVMEDTFSLEKDIEACFTGYNDHCK